MQYQVTITIDQIDEVQGTTGYIDSHQVILAESYELASHAWNLAVEATEAALDKARW